MTDLCMASLFLCSLSFITAWNLSRRSIFYTETNTSLTTPHITGYICQQQTSQQQLSIATVRAGGSHLWLGERWLRRTVNRGDSGSIPLTAVSKLRQFHSPHICLCLSEETLKADGSFYLMSMPGEVKDSRQGVNVQPVVDSLILEDNSKYGRSLEETT